MVIDTEGNASLIPLEVEKPATCCHIDADGLACDKAADYYIYNPAKRYDDTYVCKGHVGEILWDAPALTIVPADKGGIDYWLDNTLVTVSSTSNLIQQEY